MSLAKPRLIILVAVSSILLLTPSLSVGDNITLPSVTVTPTVTTPVSPAVTVPTNPTVNIPITSGAPIIVPTQIPVVNPVVQPTQAPVILPTQTPVVVLPVTNSTVVLPTATPVSPADAAQAARYQKSSDAQSKAATANLIGMGLWGGVGALCGYNCFNYLTGYRKQQNETNESQASLNKASAAYIACRKNIQKTQQGQFQEEANKQIADDLKKLLAEQRAILAENASADSSSKTQSERATAQVTETNDPNVAAEAAIKEKEALLATANKDKAAADKANGGATKLANNAIKLRALGTKQTKIALDLSAKAQADNETACANESSALQTAETTHNTSAAKLDVNANKVVKYGKLCAYGSMGAAVADMGVSGLYAKNIMGGLPSLAGAAPGMAAIGSSFLSKNTKPADQAIPMGLSSCATTAASMAMIALKTVNYMKDSSGADKNLKKANQLRNGATLDLKRFLNSILPEAYASNETFMPSCEGPLETHSARLNCGMEGDPILHGFLSEEAGRERAIASTFNGLFQTSYEKFVDGRQPLDFGKVAALMTRDYPQLAPGVMNLYKEAEHKTRLSLGVTEDDGWVPQPFTPTMNMPVPPITEDAASVIPVGTPLPPGYIKAAQVLSELNRVPAAGEDPNSTSQNQESIFEIISRKYRQLNDRISGPAD